MTLIDSHCHLDFPIFDQDRSAVIKQAQHNNISRIIIPAISQQYWQRMEETQSKHPISALAYGLHPLFMRQHQPEHITLLHQKLFQGNAIAVGECGLDFYPSGQSQSEINLQIEYFDQQLKLAKEFQLPVIIHARKSIDIVLKMIRKYGGLNGIIHSYSGSLQQAEYCIKAGFLLGFGGPMTYSRATKLRHLVSKLPLEKLVLESDAPDQVPQPHYGERNQPAYIIDSLTIMAELKKLSIEEVATQTTANIKEVFSL
ncbi:MAG: TatD family hydrolase [Thiotrichaceae bacterium]|nr:TatD family hydrolase [Thiotrichaceae bacterium]